MCVRADAACGLGKRGRRGNENGGVWSGAANTRYAVEALESVWSSHRGILDDVDLWRLPTCMDSKAIRRETATATLLRRVRAARTLCTITTSLPGPTQSDTCWRSPS